LFLYAQLCGGVPAEPHISAISGRRIPNQKTAKNPRSKSQSSPKIKLAGDAFHRVPNRILHPQDENRSA
jgi:hypothetical protein